MTGPRAIDQHVFAAPTLFLLLAVFTTSAAAQSLGDVARRETDRRKEVASSRTYTNDDLIVIDPPQTQTLPVAATEKPAPTAADAPAFVIEENAGTGTVNLESTGKAREKRDEQYWRKLARDLRGRVERANAEIAAQQARIAGIDAGPQTPMAIREREVISNTLIRLQKDASAHTQQLTLFLTRAQLANIPEEWFR